MNLYVIFLSTDTNYQSVRRLISDYPVLKKGFKLKEILSLPSLSFDDRKRLKKMFGGDYSEILTPGINFRFRNGKWEVQEIDIKRGFHQFTTKVLNHALKDGEYPVNSPVSTMDMELLEFIMKKENQVYGKELKEFEKGGRLPITQELLEFVSKSLRERLGEVSHFDYVFVRTFRESVHDFEEILIRRELKD